MMCCISSLAEDYNCTFSTLKYGGLARYIMNTPNINIIVQGGSQQSVTSTPHSNQTMHEVSDY